MRQLEILETMLIWSVSPRSRKKSSVHWLARWGWWQRFRYRPWSRHYLPYIASTW